MQRPNTTALIAASLLSLLVFPSLLVAQPFRALKDDDFKRISFVGRCEQNQWDTSRDDKLEIMLSAEPGESCEARLHFNAPQTLKDIASLRFRVRSSRPKQRMAIELVSDVAGASEDSLARTRPFTVSDEWAPNALRLGAVTKGWQAKTISEIRFIAMSETGRSAPSLFVSDIRFTEAKAAAEASAPEGTIAPPAADIPLERQMICVAASELPSLQSPAGKILPDSLSSQAKQLMKTLWAERLGFSATLRRTAEVGLVWGLTAVWLIRRKKPSITALAAPLYELNTRTWKSLRDADGVHHLGGFNSLTAFDLEEIKGAGFNSLWLMGIWDIGPKVRAISKRYGPDFQGSPFAIRDYRASEELGTEKEFDALVDRAHRAGLKVIVDFVPNHMGLDSDWMNSHPEYFIHKAVPPTEEHLLDSEIEKRHPGYFVHRTPSYPQGSRRVPKTLLFAYGKDPYFYPWIDTAQLDYAEPSLRRKMTEVLCDLARRVDGVRCDMAMLVLREQVKIHRHPDMAWETFNRLMPDEFWPAAIRAAKRIKPNFIFMAETYWAMEGYLQELGFDYTYNKPLYEAVCSAFQSGNAEGLLNFIRMLGHDFLARGVHFIENHDEERAMNALGEERQRAAAITLCTLPGIALVHQGQMEGKRERLPVQRAVALNKEPDNTSLRRFYEGLLKATALPLFREGRLNVLYSNNPAFISYARFDGDQKAVVIINTSNQTQKGIVTVTPGVNLKAGTEYELRDLFYPLKAESTREKTTVQPAYRFGAAQLINQGLYVELEPFDAHLFLVEPQSGYKLRERLAHALGLTFLMPKPRVHGRWGWSQFRRVLGGGE